jgi:diguanylate cyclase (GGDEF)-like protein/PAS domain S-box-containing protein
MDFARRFLLLTLIGYVMALASVALALWAEGIPTLRKFHAAALQSHAQTRAGAVEDAIDGILSGAMVVARSPTTVTYLERRDGMTESRMRMAMTRLVGSRVSQVMLLDSSGRSILLELGPVHKPDFELADIRSQARSLMHGGPGAEPAVSFRAADARQTGEAVFLVMIPVLSYGQPVGFLAVEKHVDLTHVLALNGVAATATLSTAFQVHMLDQWYGKQAGRVAAPVPGTDFFVTLAPNEGLTWKLGREMGAAVLLFAAVILAVPFVVMGLVGRRFIVAPHRVLEESRRMLAKKQSELSELAQIAEMSHDAIVVTDRDRKILWTNPAFLGLTGYDLHEVLGRNPDQLLHGPDTDPGAARDLKMAAEHCSALRTEILNYRRDGRPYWAYVSLSPIFGPDGKAERFASISSDVTARKRYEDELRQAKQDLERQALHDSLTGLPNRRALERHMRPMDGGGPRTLLRVDLDKFKNVNDTHGHAAGDHVLVRVAEILRAGIRPGDLAARIGGDEFVVVLAPESGPEQAEALARRLRAEIGRDIPFESKTCRVGASFGIASAADGLVENRDLLGGADAALYASKGAGRNTITLYTPSLHRDVLEKRALATEIERAVLREEFEPFFQPQFSATTHQLVGLETLARWNHPERGILCPADFLSLAGQLSMVPEIDRIIYRKGLEEIASLNAAGFAIPKVSFNVGVAQLRDSTLPALAEQIDIGDTRISLEILESVLVEDQTEEFGFHVDLLRERGFGLEIDDFGSGHASVVGLMHLGPDIMKIDQRLVIPITHAERVRRLVRNIVEIGETFGIAVTAEGVETADHAAILSALGCDTLQGFHFSRPLCAGDLRVRLSEDRLLPGREGQPASSTGAPRR